MLARAVRLRLGRRLSLHRRLALEQLHHRAPRAEVVHELVALLHVGLHHEPEEVRALDRLLALLDQRTLSALVLLDDRVLERVPRLGRECKRLVVTDDLDRDAPSREQPIDTERREHAPEGGALRIGRVQAARAVPRQRCRGLNGANNRRVRLRYLSVRFGAEAGSARAKPALALAAAAAAAAAANEAAGAAGAARAKGSRACVHRARVQLPR